jgi:hemerythrin superfamily protein
VHRQCAHDLVHDTVEKEFLYPTVRQRLETGGELADHGTTEHDEVARTLVAVDKAEAGSDELTTALHTLIGLVRTHVGEEESQIFPALRTAMSTAELADLGETLATAKQSAPTRPHPLAPSGALGAMVAGALSAPLDKVRDIVEGRPPPLGAARDAPCTGGPTAPRPHGPSAPRPDGLRLGVRRFAPSGLTTSVLLGIHTG